MAELATLVSFSVAYLIALVGRTQCSLEENTLLIEQFKDFISLYKKEYSSADEFLLRFQIFKDNLAHSKLMNKPHNSSDLTVYGVNKFADLTAQEFRERYLTGLTRNWSINNKFTFATMPADHRSLGIPKKFDWREKGVLTGIRDQGKCGACWSFSIVETIESMFAVMYKSQSSVPELSVQQLIDCDHDNNGCKGGDIFEASKWAQLNGVVNESLYPLTDRTDNCKTVPPSVPRIFVKDYSCNRFVGRESDMLKLLVEHGPIAAAVDATTWHNYVGGIIQFHCSDYINHAVQIVGYDLTGDVPYYIIRNSWGKDFGDHGFIYVKYGDNLCGLTSEVCHLNVTNYH